MPRIPYNDKLAEDNYQSSNIKNLIDNNTNDDLLENTLSGGGYQQEDNTQHAVEPGARYQMQKRKGNA